MTQMDLLRAIGNAEDMYIEELHSYLDGQRKRKRPGMVFLAALIAILLMVLTVGAVGTVQWEEDSWFDSFFALPSQEIDPDAVTDHQLELLDKGLVDIGQAVTQEGYTITLASALFDGHRLLAKILVEAPEGVVLEKGRYDMILEYRPLYPDGTKLPFGAMAGSCGQLEDPDPTDGMLQFLLDVRMQPKPDADAAMLMGAKWEICISELQYAYSLEEEYWINPLATGDWCFSIPFDESSLLTDEFEILEKPVWLHGTRYWEDRAFPVNIKVTSLRLRALSASLCYDKPLTGFWDGIDIGDIYVVMKDGTKILADWDMGHNNGRYWQDTLTFPVPVAWEDVECILLPNGDQVKIG